MGSTPRNLNIYPQKRGYFQLFNFHLLLCLRVPCIYRWQHFSSSLKREKSHRICWALKVYPWWLRGKSVCLQCGRPGFDPWVGKIPWKRKWQPTPVFLSGKSHGQRSLAGYSLCNGKESDVTEHLSMHALYVLLLNSFIGQ